MAKTSAAPKRKRYDNRLPVVFGGLGSGKKKISISVHLSHGLVDMKSKNPLEMTEYPDNFVCKVLKVGLECDPNARNDAPGQEKLIEDSVLIQAQADVSGFAYKQEGITFRLSFARGSGFSLDDLDRFVGKAGSLNWSVIGNYEPKVGRPRAEDSDEEEDDEVDVP